MAVRISQPSGPSTFLQLTDFLGITKDKDRVKKIDIHADPETGVSISVEYLVPNHELEPLDKWLKSINVSDYEEVDDEGYLDE